MRRRRHLRQHSAQPDHASGERRAGDEQTRTKPLAHGASSLGRGRHPDAVRTKCARRRRIRRACRRHKAHGVREPIWLFESKILDGRNRYSAAQGAGVDCPTRSYDGDDPLSFVVSANLRRRQRYGQRAHRRRVRAGQLEAGGVTVRAPPSGTASRASVAANGFGKTQRNRGGRCRPTHARNSKSAKRGD